MLIGGKNMTMNYIYSALLLHSAKKEISEENIKKIVEATGEKADHGQIKALVSSLEGVDISEAIKQSVFVAAPAAPEKPEEKKAEKKTEEEDKKKAEEAVEGLSSLFG